MNTTIASITSNTGVYDHPLSKILSKADGILLDGLKYSNYDSRRHQKNSKNVSKFVEPEISIKSMIKKHQEKKQIWDLKLKINKPNDDLSQLDNVESDEIEHIIPIKAQAISKIVKQETLVHSDLNQIPDSCKNEDRCMSQPYFKKSKPDKNQAKKANKAIKQTKSPVDSLKLDSSRAYDRDGMMKEVNDIIGELQSMLKPKIYKMESELKLESFCLNPYVDCAKDLSKTKFGSDDATLNLYSYDDDESNNITLTNFDDSEEPRNEYKDPQCFSSPAAQVSAGVLRNKLNFGSVNNANFYSKKTLK